MLAASLLLCSAFAVIGAGAFPGDPVLKACEKALKGRLMNPASFDSLGVSTTDDTMDAAAYRAFLHARGVASAQIGPDQAISRHTSYHRYRADGALGPTAAIAECEFVTVRSAAGEAVAWHLFVDGRPEYPPIIR